MAKIEKWDYFWDTLSLLFIRKDTVYEAVVTGEKHGWETGENGIELKRWMRDFNAWYRKLEENKRNETAKARMASQCYQHWRYFKIHNTPISKILKEMLLDWRTIILVSSAICRQYFLAVQYDNRVRDPTYCWFLQQSKRSLNRIFMRVFVKIFSCLLS